MAEITLLAQAREISRGGGLACLNKLR